MADEIMEQVQDVQSIDPAGLDESALDAALNDTGEQSQGTPDEQSQEQQEEQQTEEPAAPEEPEETEADRTAKLEKQLKDKEEFIQRRNSEIGALRQQIQALQTQVPQQPAEDEFYANPYDAVQKVLAAERQNAAVQALQAQAAVMQNELAVKSAIPEIDALIDDIAKLAEQDGLPPENIRNFKANPYNDDPAILIQYANRAKLAKELADMRAQIEALQKKPETIVKKIEQAAHSHRPLTSNTGQSGTPNTADIPSHRLTDQELDDLLRA